MRPQPLSIVHVVAPADVGGLESVVEQLVVNQRATGHDASVLAILSRPDAAIHWREALASRGVPVQTIVSPGRQYVGEWRTLAARFHATASAIVHTHGYRADVIAGDAARRAGAATISTVHGFTGGDWKNRLFERIQRRALRSFDAVVAVSRPMRDDLLASGVRATRLHAIPNAFDVRDDFMSRDDARRELRIGDNAPRVGWIGRLSREKGPDVMLAAFAAMRVDDARLSIVGDGPERVRLEAQARELAISERVTWHGTRPNARRVLRAFDLVVLSSRTEGTPVVLLEAMAAGIPIVATRVGGIPDVVSEAHARLVAAGSPTDLATAMAQALENHQDAVARASRATERLVTQYAVAPWIAAYDIVYDVSLQHDMRASA